MAQLALLKLFFLLQPVSLGQKANCKSCMLILRIFILYQTGGKTSLNLSKAHHSSSSPFAHFLLSHSLVKQERNQAYVEISGMLKQSDTNHCLAHCTMSSDFCSEETLEKCGNQQHCKYHLQASWNARE